MIRSGVPCTNCGEIGHQQRYCTAPVSSYGVILFRIKDPKWNPLEKLAAQEVTSNVIAPNDLEFCLIQRKDSIGFIELVRGKYKVNDLDYIREQIAGMTKEERDLIASNQLDILWKKVWGEENKQYKHDFEVSRDKFQQLQRGILCPKTQQIVTLDSLLKEIPCNWNTPEWGFPKGRRNRFESDYDCAVRETCEETGLIKRDFIILQNLCPIRETFFGNNHVYYTHVYYLGWCPYDTNVSMDTDDKLMRQEIGDIGWFSIEECLNKIRSTNLEKREILLHACRILKNTCPIILHKSVIPAIIDAQRNPVIRQNECLGDQPRNGGGLNEYSGPSTYGFIEEEHK